MINLDLAEAELMGRFDKFVADGKKLAKDNSDAFEFSLDGSTATLRVIVGNGDVVESYMTLNIKRNHIHGLKTDTKTIKAKD